MEKLVIFAIEKSGLDLVPTGGEQRQADSVGLLFINQPRVQPSASGGSSPATAMDFNNKYL